jgi:hypothetical protein
VNSGHPPGQRGTAGGRIAGALIVVALIVMVIVSIHWIRVISERSDSAAVSAAEDPTTEPTQTQDTPTPSPSPTDDGPSEVGQTRAGENADTTLLQVRKVVAPSGSEPSAGEEWFGLRAETCVHADASPSGAVGWSSWLAVDNDGEKYRGTEAPFDDFPPQQFATTRIQPGECNTGWILIAVPEGASRTIETVVFRPNAPEPAEWAV